MSNFELNIEKHCYMTCSGQKIVQGLCDCHNRLKNRIYMEKLAKKNTNPPPNNSGSDNIIDGVGC